jgi:hypothetical protein
MHPSGTTDTVRILPFTGTISNPTKVGSYAIAQSSIETEKSEWNPGARLYDAFGGSCGRSTVGGKFRRGSLPVRCF